MKEFSPKEYLILGDAHAGTRDGNQLVMEQQISYLESVVIPHMLENNISVMIQTGDIFDVRKHTNTAVLHEWKTRFFDVLQKNGIILIVYVGNHDSFYKNTLTPNTVNELLGEYNNVYIINEPEEISLGGTKSLVVPWICQSNEEIAMKMINESDASVCFGHFEIKGAKMESSVCDDGLPLSTFKRFAKTISGHFHIKGDYEDVTYVGTPYEMSWGDFGNEKGFHIFNVEDLTLTFHKNDNQLYHKITYNEDQDMEFYLKQDYKDKYIKVVIEHRQDFKKYESWLLKLESKGSATLSIIEPIMDRDAKDSNIEDNGDLKILSTEEIIESYVDDVYPERKDKLTKMMLGLHSTARSIHG